MWEGGKLFLRADRPTTKRGALDRVELRRDVFVAVVDTIKASVDEKHGSIGSHGVSLEKNRTGSSVFETSRKARSSRSIGFAASRRRHESVSAPSPAAGARVRQLRQSGCRRAGGARRGAASTFDSAVVDVAGTCKLATGVAAMSAAAAASSATWTRPSAPSPSDVRRDGRHEARRPRRRS